MDICEIKKIHDFYINNDTVGIVKLAKIFAKDKGSLVGFFKRRNLFIKPRITCRAYISFNGVKYYKQKDGYKSAGRNSVFLHQIIYFGSIDKILPGRIAFKSGKITTFNKENMYFVKK